MKPLYLLSSIFYLLALSVRAELTATVYPGYTLRVDERPTTSILNQMARPTVTVSGTLGGTNIGLEAHSVSGAMLKTSVVDDDTIEFFDNGGVTAMRVKAYNIGTNVINSNIAGLGLGGGNGFALSNKVDGAAITITNDVITLATNLSPTYLGVASNAVVVGSSTNRGNAVDMGVFAKMLYTNSFVSAETTIGVGGTILDTAHGLGQIPSLVRWVLVCKTNDVTFLVGQELDQTGVYGGAGGSPFSVYVTSTNVLVNESAAYNSHAAITTTGTGQALNSARWKIKVYARP